MQSPDNELDDPGYIEDAVNMQHGTGRSRATKGNDSFITNLIKRSRQNGKVLKKTQVFGNPYKNYYKKF